MKLPSFDEKGNISMFEVLQAKPKDYETFGVNVIELLEKLQQLLAAADSENYSEAKSDIIYDYLHQHETENVRLRKKGELPVLFCFYYTLYGLLISGCNYYHMDDPDVQTMDQEILDCEIRLVKDPKSFYGRSNQTLVNSYVGHTVTIPKGCPIDAAGEKTVAKKTYNVNIRHAYQGFYSRGVNHPMLVWSGKNGWNKACIKDVLQQS